MPPLFPFFCFIDGKQGKQKVEEMMALDCF